MSVRDSIHVAGTVSGEERQQQLGLLWSSFCTSLDVYPQQTLHCPRNQARLAHSSKCLTGYLHFTRSDRYGYFVMNLENSTASTTMRTSLHLQYCHNFTRAGRAFLKHCRT